MKREPHAVLISPRQRASSLPGEGTPSRSDGTSTRDNASPTSRTVLGFLAIILNAAPILSGVSLLLRAGLAPVKDRRPSRFRLCKLSEVPAKGSTAIKRCTIGYQYRQDPRIVSVAKTVPVTRDPSSSAAGLVSAVVCTILIAFLTSSCHALRVGEGLGQAPPPVDIARFFAAQPNGRLSLRAQDPGLSYQFDPSEKDTRYAGDDKEMRFREVLMTLRPKMPIGTVLVDICFVDGNGSKIRVGPVDLLRLTPRLDCKGAMQYPELLLEEYGRFGVSFRREHGEFEIALDDACTTETKNAAGRAYRMGIWNNCLDPTKWEMILFTEDYGDFDERLAGLININQQRTLSHSWFYMSDGLYAELLRVKNPDLAIDPTLDYEALSAKAEEVVVDLTGLRRVKRRVPVKVLEIGHQSARKIEAVVPEQFYKDRFGLVLNRDEFSNYRDVLDQPVQLAQFGGCGFYKPGEPMVFDFSWLRNVDEVQVDLLDVEGSECYVQLKLGGANAEYEIVLGNVDLALLSEQTFQGLAFGINPYPKSRRHNPKQDTIRFESDRIPDNILPYSILKKTASGTWVNNQKLGVEKVFLGWESIERKVLTVYLATYERIVSVWMARVRLPDSLVDRVRIRRRLYDY